MIPLFIPETKGLSLEALDARFSISTRSHVSWVIKDVAWAFRHYVLRRDVRRPMLCVSSKDDSGLQLPTIVRRQVPLHKQRTEKGEAEA